MFCNIFKLNYIDMMSQRNDLSYQRTRHFSDPTPSRYGTKYHRRGGKRNNRPEPNRRTINADDVHSLTVSIDRALTTDGNTSQDSFFTDRAVKHTKNSRPSMENYSPANSRQGWWRITIPDAGKIGKQLVLESLQGKCVRPFLPYHYNIDHRSQDGIFFVNNQNDADMLRRLNGKVEVRGIDTVRVLMCRVPVPTPSIDENSRPHLKDHLLTRRFDQMTCKLDLTNLADDEELSSLGIFPQTNKNAFMRDVIDIINKDLPMTRMLDLGSNNIMSLFEFRNLHLAHLVQISLASNRLRNVDDFDHLKQLPNLTHIYIKNNPLVPSNSKQSNSIDDIISTIQKKVPQLKRIDDTDLPTIIRFGTDIEVATLPKSLPYCVPAGEIQTFLTKFIHVFFGSFDTPGREELHQCYHELCMFSLCITNIDNTFVPMRQYRYGQLIHESRNLKKLIDDNRRNSLLRRGKAMTMEFLKKKFPLTKHDGNSFHVDVISAANNRAIFTINGLFKEVDQSANNPVRCFQRTFTCAPTEAGVLIIADHLMLTNPTEAQFSKMNHLSTTAPQPTSNHSDPKPLTDIQDQMIVQFSQQSGMNIEHSKFCLEQNNWDYHRAAADFLDLKQKNQIPPAAFIQS